ncbi:VOC family protein [Rhizorhabdus histidinilytica]|uniref:VOC family protein n=1 Tax=Rhizorhabdus histidinilytica TaxID=439228 RepID=UPI00321FC8F9
MARLEHCNIRSFDLAATIRFYEEVIGLRAGPVPGMNRGVWLYDDSDVAVVHVIDLDTDNRDASLKEIRHRLGDLAGPLDPDAMKGGGAVDHIAFHCDDYDAMVARIEAHGAPYRTFDLPAYQLRQILVNDPSDVTLELNFRD